MAKTMGTAPVIPAIAVIAPLEIWKASRMSGARTPKATRSKFCTPASATSTASGSKPAGPRSPSARRAPPTLPSAWDIYFPHQRQRHRYDLSGRLDPPVRQQAGHHHPAAGRDQAQERVAGTVDKVAETARKEHQQRDDPATGGKKRPSPRQQIMRAVDTDRAEHRQIRR